MAESILSRIPDEFIAEALKKLPPAEFATSDTMDTVVDVPSLGRAIITAQCIKSKRGGAVHYHWAAVSARIVSR
jgi:hypothetical protein